MELADIEIFLAAAESGSFSKAAERLYVDHSTVSRAVARLEAELGAALFLRDSRGVAATAAGETLRAGGRALLDAAEALAKDIKTKGDKICTDMENS